ncbi:hypothetical protein VNO80_02958 [Phaseolus coccineus]|uniref:Uncharacterized protein n=1 Tax=Phaseolus coccineus TaxID=3886 RepID=A0AAN9NRB8_PHACN
MEDVFTFMKMNSDFGNRIRLRQGACHLIQVVLHLGDLLDQGRDLSASSMQAEIRSSHVADCTTYSSFRVKLSWTPFAKCKPPLSKGVVSLATELGDGRGRGLDFDTRWDLWEPDLFFFSPKECWYLSGAPS